MNIKLIKEPFGHVIIENTFDENDMNALWDEILFLQFRMTNETSQAKSNFGSEVKRGSGIFLDNFFLHPNHSVIFSLTRNLVTNKITEDASNLDYYFKLMHRIDNDSILLQCYKNGDYYLPHIDESIFTSVTLMHKEPKKFTGGDFYFPQYNYKPQLKNNYTIIFPSTISHEVEEVKLNSTDPSDFRYTITMFLGNREYKKNQE